MKNILRRISICLFWLLCSIPTRANPDDVLRDCLLTADEAAITTLSLTASQVLAMASIARVSANPTTDVGIPEEELAENLAEFESALDSLALGSNEDQLTTATMLEGESWMAKILLVAWDRSERPEHYEEVVNYLQADPIALGGRVLPTCRLAAIPRTDEWRLPVEYALLRPWQPGEGVARASRFYDRHRFDLPEASLVSYSPSSAWDSRAVPCLILYAKNAMLEYSDGSLEGSSTDENLFAVLVLLGAMPSELNLRMQAMLVTCSERAISSSFADEFAGLLVGTTNETSDWDELYGAGESVVDSANLEGFGILKSLRQGTD
ncbi:hypothetical protein KQI84_13125 [bacterium]|nr:hypothetical protein [bacterium]